MKNNYYYELIMGYPIYYETLCIYPVSFSTLYKYFGINGFDYLMIPFCITSEYAKEVLNIDTTEDNIFNDVILKNEDLLKNVCLILTAFCKCGKTTLLNNVLCLYDEKNENKIFEITNDNFNDISEILLKLNGKNKIVIEKPPKNMSARQKDVWEKLQAGRKRDAEKNRLHIYDMINICEFGGNYHIPISEIETWTLWKLTICYNSITGIKEYDDSLKIGIANYDLSSVQKDNYWIKKMMIRD